MNQPSSPDQQALQAALQGCDTTAALAAATALVRKNPADPRLRVALFQLLLVTGQWDRALTQGKVAADMDAGAIPMARVFEILITCEKMRQQVLAGQSTPLIMGEPPAWLAGMFEALRLQNQGSNEAAAQVRASALEQAPAVPGSIDGERFEWCSDADSRFGPVLEACITGKYYWIPFEQIASISIEEPVDLRDFTWAPVVIEFVNRGQTDAFVPSRYPGSETQTDGALQLARSTAWNEPAPGTFIGLGQREFATDASTYPMLACRSIRFDHPAPAAG